MKLAVAISTYQRSDGTTPQYLQRALKSVYNQTHQDYKVFLIGDHYEDQSEFDSFGEMFLDDQLYKKNLDFAVERSKYEMGSKMLWCCGGANAHNTLIDEILTQGYDYVCRLDHDDYWAPDHLENINKVLESRKKVSCVYTCSTHFDSSYLPKVTTLDGQIYNSFPIPFNVIHSSTCINYRLVPLRYRDVFAETGNIVEADVDMWRRLKDFSIQNGLQSFLVTKITCYHPVEMSKSI